VRLDGDFLGCLWYINVFIDLIVIYPLVNKQLDPENHQFLIETSLPSPTTARIELLIYQRVMGSNGMKTMVIVMGYDRAICTSQKLNY
jgi:hypothetical protein